MKDNPYTRIGYNLSTDYEELFWTSITFTEGLYYAIPPELADDQGQPDQFFDLWLGGWVWGTLIGLALTLVVLTLVLLGRAA